MSYETPFKDALQELHDRRVDFIGQWEERHQDDERYADIFRETAQKLWAFYVQQVTIRITPEPPEGDEFYPNMAHWEFWRGVATDGPAIDFVEKLQSFLSNAILDDSYFKIVKVRWSLTENDFIVLKDGDETWRGALQVRWTDGDDPDRSTNIDELVDAWDRHLAASKDRFDRIKESGGYKG